MKRIINTSILRKACRIEYKTEDGFITLSFNEDQTEYTISPIKNSEYLVMIQTEGASEGPMTAVPWCDPVDTWLSEGRLSIYDESQMDDNTVFLATLMYTELLKLNRKMKIAQAAVELGKALEV
jgi:hypothetical protein